jgi:hypothetical protein
MRPLCSLRSLRHLLSSALCLIPALAAAVPFDVQVYDRTEARYLPTYQFEGRTYVVGKPGNEYSLSLRNQSGERVMVVSSVDGVNIITGETASPQQSGYVLAPGQSAEITGWRKSMANTAAFYFTEHDNSYAARTGRPNDVGVIGVAVFRERHVQPPIRLYKPLNEGKNEPSPYNSAEPEPGRADAAESAQSAPGAASGELSRRAEKSLGTGHGRIEQSETRYTDFQRASTTPDQVITLYYDTYSNLQAKGVPVWRDGGNRYAYKPQPRPFPRDPTPGFVPDPR